MILNEEIFEIDIPNVVHDDIEISNLETEIPQPGPEIGISNLITQLINSTYSMIEDYNSLSIALSDNQETEKAQIVSSMISNEHVHIGMLQSLLECFSPNADSVEEGEEIIDSTINESLKEDYNYSKADLIEFIKWNSNAPLKVLNKASKEDLENLLKQKGAFNRFISTLNKYRYASSKEKELNATLRELKNKSVKNESLPMNNGVDLEKVCRQIWKDLDGDVSDKEDWDNWLEVYWDDISKLINGESYTKMTVEGDSSKARLNLKTEGRHIVYKFFDEDEYYTAYDVQEIEDAIKRRNLNESLTEAKVRPNIVNVQGIYDYVVENGFEKEAKEILDDCKIKVVKGKCTEISANANPGNAYYRLSHLVDSKNESLNESISDKFIDDKIWEIFNACIEHNSEADYDVNKAIEYYFIQQNLPSSDDLETDINGLTRYDKLNLLDRIMGVAEQYHLLESLNEEVDNEFLTAKVAFEEAIEDGIDDPIYQGVDDDFISDLCFDVENSLDVKSEASIQGGEDVVVFYIEDSQVTLDYHDFNQDIVDIVFNSNSSKQFKSKYKKYLLSKIMGKLVEESLTESMTQEQFEERIETVMKPFAADLDAFEDENGDDFYITWSFGVNDDDKITAGLDIHFDRRFMDEETKDFDEETIKPFLDELESIIDKHGFELDNVNGYDYKVKGPKTAMFTKARHYQIIEK